MELDLTFYDHPLTVTQPDKTTVLVNKHFALSSEYAPTVEALGAIYGTGMLRAEAAQAFRTMADAARADGLTLKSVSAYRSYRTQEVLYNYYLRQNPQNVVDDYSARPGHSEHQTGLALDINVASTSAHFENSVEYAWLLGGTNEVGNATEGRMLYTVSRGFQNRKTCGDQNRNGFGPFRLRFQVFLTFGLLLKRMVGRTPWPGLLSTTDTVSSMCRQSHTLVPLAHSVGQNRPSTGTRPRCPTVARDHSDQTSSHHPSCGIGLSLLRPSWTALSQAASGVMPISRWTSKPLR